MTGEYNIDYRQEADGRRLDRDFEAAGDNYTVAAYKELEESEYAVWRQLGSGLAELAHAAICYKLSEAPGRCKNRCQQGLLIAEDLEENVAEAEPQKGLMYELAGDFKLIGDIGQYSQEYERAEQIYARYESDSLRWQAESEFEVGIAPFIRVVQSVDHTIERYSRVRSSSLLVRINYKSDHFPELLEELIESGKWVWEDEEDISN